MIYIIDDDREFVECIAKIISCVVEGAKVRVFSNAVEAMSVIGEELPGLIFLDVLLDGPDGFTFLNEMLSYEDTEKIPIVIMSSLNFKGKDLKNYGVVEVLDKAKMTPEDIKRIVVKYVSAKK